MTAAQHGGLIRTFLGRGSLVAAGVFLSGARMLILLVLLGQFGESVVGAFGYAQNVYGIAAVLCAGHGIAIVAQLAGGPASGTVDAQRRLSKALRTAWASTVALLVVAVAFGAASALVLPVHLPTFTVAYAAAMMSALFLPLAQTLAGLQQARGQEHLSLLHTIEGFGISVCIAAAAVVLTHDPLVAVGAIGIACCLGDGWSTARRYRSLRSEVRGLPSAALRDFVAAPGVSLAQVPRTAAGGYDGLILMAAFLLISQLALAQDATTGAVTVTLIAVVRTIVVPLKSFGVVGGRLIRSQTTDPVLSAQLFWRLVRVGALALLPLSLICIVTPSLPALMLHLPLTGDVELAVRLIGIQLLLDPLTGLGAAMLKILVTPTALLIPLAVSLWGWAVPALLTANLLGHVTIVNIWIVLVAARLLFGLLVVRATHPTRLVPSRAAA